MPINQNRNNNNKTQIDTNYAHLQPQAVELEKVVLGALMIDTDAFSVVSEMLKPETFYDPRHQKNLRGDSDHEYGGAPRGYHDRYG